MRILLSLLAVALLSFAPGLARAETAASTPSFTDAQRTEIESILKEYLTKKNPEVLIEAGQELQRRQSAEAETKSKAALAASRDKIFNDPSTPTGGNPKGDVTVVEFFDYQCGYCKMSAPTVAKLLKEDKNVRFIYKEYPILGPVSTEASKAAFASIKQGKYVKFHDALMSRPGHIASDDIYRVAKEVGIDVEKLKKDMADESVTKLVDASLALGGEVGVRGTPMFIIGEQTFPGAMQYEQIKKAVDDARAAAKK